MDDICINCRNDDCIGKEIELPRLSEREKNEPRLVVEENGWQYHFSYGHLLGVFP